MTSKFPGNTIVKAPGQYFSVRWIKALCNSESFYNLSNSKATC